MTTSLYPMSQAVEHATSLLGMAPERVRPVLWPLWRVGTVAEVHERQPLQTIDRFVLRAIAEAGLTDSAAIAAFLNLPLGTVTRCAESLRHTGQVGAASPLELTDLGRASLEAGSLYMTRKVRQTVLIERQSGWPLPRAYREAGVELLENPGDSTAFERLPTAAGFSPDVLTWLRNHPQPDSFGLPSPLHGLTLEGSVGEVFLPGYLVHTADGSVLAYSALGEGRDGFLERVLSRH